MAFVCETEVAVQATMLQVRKPRPDLESLVVGPLFPERFVGPLAAVRRCD